jgi:hypothetical protein
VHVGLVDRNRTLAGNGEETELLIQGRIDWVFDVGIDGEFGGKKVKQKVKFRPDLLFRFYPMFRR